MSLKIKKINKNNVFKKILFFIFIILFISSISFFIFASLLANNKSLEVRYQFVTFCNDNKFLGFLPKIFYEQKYIDLLLSLKEQKQISHSSEQNISKINSFFKKEFIEDTYYANIFVLKDKDRISVKVSESLDLNTDNAFNLEKIYNEDKYIFSLPILRKKDFNKNTFLLKDYKILSGIIDKKYPVFAIDKNNNIVIDNILINEINQENNFKFAIDGVDLLLKNKEKVSYNSNDNELNNKRTSRLVFALDKENNFIIICLNSNTPNSMGISNNELYDLMEKFDIVDALQMHFYNDGFIYNDKYYKNIFVNEELYLSAILIK